jgi:hypothetical protein
METQRCAGCGQRFAPRPQTPTQRFCSSPACQRERRRRWQRERRRHDPDYRENQARAQHQWAAAHPEYWRQYRAEHPEYAARNRAQQRERDQRRRGGGAALLESAAPQGHAAGAELAKSDAYASIAPLPTGTYELIRVDPDPGAALAKKNAWTVEIRALSMR